MKEGRKKNSPVELDDIDRRIIKLFSEDGRMSYRKIAKDLNISIGTVHNRMEKLNKNGVIQKFAPVLDHSKLGYNLTTIIGVQVKEEF